jgi:hypothetical protein
MRFAKIEFDTEESCAQALHGLMQRGKIIALRNQVFIVPEPAVAWLTSQQITHHVVEWLNQDDVVQTLRNTAAHPV